MTIDRRTNKLASGSVRIAAGPVALAGEWCVPTGGVGIVLFAHGSGSSRHSPRNQAVARALQDSGTGTLLFDLLTHEEGGGVVPEAFETEMIGVYERPLQTHPGCGRAANRFTG